MSTLLQVNYLINNCPTLFSTCIKKSLQIRNKMNCARDILKVPLVPRGCKLISPLTIIQQFLIVLFSNFVKPFHQIPSFPTKLSANYFRYQLAQSTYILLAWSKYLEHGTTYQQCGVIFLHIHICKINLRIFILSCIRINIYIFIFKLNTFQFDTSVV